MNNYKKILAGVLATSMVLSSSMVALADEGRTTGSGKVEGRCLMTCLELCCRRRRAIRGRLIM